MAYTTEKHMTMAFTLCTTRQHSLRL